MAEMGGELTPERIAKGKELTAFFASLDENDPANQPTDDETKRPSPLKGIVDMRTIDSQARAEWTTKTDKGANEG